jgi:hypothetical protein
MTKSEESKFIYWVNVEGEKRWIKKGELEPAYYK